MSKKSDKFFSRKPWWPFASFPSVGEFSIAGIKCVTEEKKAQRDSFIKWSDSYLQHKVRVCDLNRREVSHEHQVRVLCHLQPSLIRNHHCTSHGLSTNQHFQFRLRCFESVREFGGMIHRRRGRGRRCSRDGSLAGH